MFGQIECDGWSGQIGQDEFEQHPIFQFSKIEIFRFGNTNQRTQRMANNEQWCLVFAGQDPNIQICYNQKRNDNQTKR